MTTGCQVFDDLFQNLESDVITTVYGPGGTGKTTMCMLAAIQVVRNGGKVMYMDTEGGFSVERFKQVAGPDYEQLLEKITFVKPVTFEEQARTLQTLKDKLSDEIQLLVMDSIAMLYRLELGKDDKYEASRNLGTQISYLTEIARRKKIPVLVANQIYTNIDNGQARMVGGDLLIYGSKCLVEIEKTGTLRKGTLKKHRSKPEKSVVFKLTQEGTTLA